MAAPRARPGRRGGRLALAATAILAATLPGARAQFGMPGGMAPDKVPPAVASDIPFVACQVCRLVIEEAARLADGVRQDAAAKPGKKVMKKWPADRAAGREQLAAPAPRGTARSPRSRATAPANALSRPPPPTTHTHTHTHTSSRRPT
jgi:hypothetical protein